jgi:hypothetical protein
MLRAGIVVLAGCALVAGSASGGTTAKPRPPKVAVGIALAGQSPVAAGDEVTLTARVRALPKGYRLILEAKESPEDSWSIFKECAKASCSEVWSEADAYTVSFRSRAIHRRSVTKGPITQVAGTSRIVTATWAASPPPPPPPPTAKAGTYCGFNDQGREVCLDVSADGSAVTRFQTQSLVTCTNGTQWYWLLTFSGRAVPIDNLSFTYAYSGPLTSSSTTTTNLQTTYSISGTLDLNGNATGTITLSSMSWDANGTHYDCTSAPYGWHAKLGA